MIKVKYRLYDIELYPEDVPVLEKQFNSLREFTTWKDNYHRHGWLCLDIIETFLLNPPL